MKKGEVWYSAYFEQGNLVTRKHTIEYVSEKQVRVSGALVRLGDFGVNYVSRATPERMARFLHPSRLRALYALSTRLQNNVREREKRLKEAHEALETCNKAIAVEET